MGIITSLVRGIPRRETCIQLPEPAGSPPVESNVVISLRLALAYTPITKAGSKIFAAWLTVLLFFCKVEIGTSTTSE